jgi:3',5'-cyclic AMP phosphodiesterase CpdA
MIRYDKFLSVFAFALLVSGIIAAQVKTSPQSAPDKVLVVNGKAVDAKIRQIDGHSYVDIEALAQATNGVITFEQNRVLLTIPAQAVQATQGLSKNFASAAIAEVAEMREWRGVIGTMVTYGLAVSGSWDHDYRERQVEGLRQATLAASTDEDKNALQLMKNESDNLAAWANDAIAARQDLNGSKTVDPNALQNDPALTKITSCSRFLNAMLISGTFSDDESCH